MPKGKPDQSVVPAFYCEVVCWYEVEDEKAREYAFRCENETPITWEGGRREQLRFTSG
jgi:hypothetical protein